MCLSLFHSLLPRLERNYPTFVVPSLSDFLAVVHRRKVESTLRPSLSEEEENFHQIAKFETVRSILSYCLYNGQLWQLSAKMILRGIEKTCQQFSEMSRIVIFTFAMDCTSRSTVKIPYPNFLLPTASTPLSLKWIGNLDVLPQLPNSYNSNIVSTFLCENHLLCNISIF